MKNHVSTQFKHLFASTSQSPSSKILRFSESLRKSNGKKWSQIWKLLLIKGVKLPHKKVNFGEFCLTSRIFLVSVLLSATVERCFVSCMRDFLKILIITNFIYNVNLTFTGKIIRNNFKSIYSYSNLFSAA